MRRQQIFLRKKLRVAAVQRARVSSVEAVRHGRRRQVFCITVVVCVIAAVVVVVVVVVVVATAVVLAVYRPRSHHQ